MIFAALDRRVAMLLAMTKRGQGNGRLVLVGCVDVLATLFTRVIMPDKVHAELLHPNAPSPVRHLAAHPPSWLIPSAVSDAERDLPPQLDDGERAAFALALSTKADLVLMDDRAGVAVASYGRLG